MPSDYKRIRQDNLERYGTDTYLFELLGTLYSDRTHFIFEILQNAEDVGATTLEFHLWPDRVEIHHDGRPFSEANVRGICSVGRGTKVEDLTQIGRFGIGFKSVYAYVTNPEIHSGDEHFRIEHFVRPESTLPRNPPAGFTTTFILPFGNASHHANQAFAEIETAFQKLSPTTLLFLRMINAVTVVINGESVVRLVRTVCAEPSDNIRRIAIDTFGRNDAQEGWLVISEPTTLRTDDGSEVILPIELAFRLRLDVSTKQHVIELEKGSMLFAFFPTHKQTHLGFLIQGPYRTTPARDNIPANDPINRQLVQATAQLVVRALRNLKSLNILTVRVLETMPIDEDHFPAASLLYPIYEGVRIALRDEALLPLHTSDIDKKRFGAGGNVKAARSTELRQIVSSAQLSTLSGSSTPYSWLSPEITADKTPKLWTYLKGDIGIEEIDPETFVRRLTKEFLEAQTDRWIASLYGFFSTQGSWIRNKHSAPFASKPIVRLEDGRHDKPFKADGTPIAYFSSSHQEHFACVRTAVVHHKDARDFLVSLGYAAPDECDVVIQSVLPRYVSGTIPDEATYHRDLQHIFAALKTDSSSKRRMLQSKLTTLRFVQAINAGTGKITLRAPSDVYFHSPGLGIFFDKNSEGWFVDSMLEEFRRPLVELGASVDIRIHFRQSGSDGFVVIKNDWGDHERGLDGFDPACNVEGLKFAMEHPNLLRCKFIWNHILGPNVRAIRGQVESSSRQDFLSPSKRDAFSVMGKLAYETAWIVTKSGKAVRPNEIAPDELPDTFDRDEELEKVLKMRSFQPQSEDAQFAAKLGVSLEHVNFLKKHMREFEEFIRNKEKSQLKPKSPIAEPGKPGARQVRVAEEARHASFIERLKAERTIAVNWNVVKAARSKLRDWNTNTDDEMVCQICSGEMPFTLGDGTYYFEAAQCVKGVNRDLPQNYIALCPVCSAKYRYANTIPPTDLEKQIVAAAGLKVPIILAHEKCEISFTRTHLSDLQTALREIFKR